MEEAPHRTDLLERAIYHEICRRDGVKARDLYTHAPIPGTEGVLSVCAGDMLFNLFDEYMGFLKG